MPPSLQLPRFMRLYLWGNVHLALGAMSTVWATRSGLAGDPVVPGALEASLFFGTLGVYGLDRLAGAAPSGPRGDWFSRHRRWMWQISVASMIVALGCMVMLPRAAQLCLLFGGAISLGYGLPVVRWHGRWQPLGAFLWARPGLVALVWTTSTATAPMLVASVDPLSVVGWQWQVSRFLLLVALVIPFDVRDRATDAMRGVRTLATWLGDARAMRVAQVAAGLALVFSVIPTFQPELIAAGVGDLIVILMTRVTYGAVWRLLVVDGVLHLYALGVIWRMIGG